MSCPNRIAPAALAAALGRLSLDHHDHHARLSADLAGLPAARLAMTGESIAGFDSRGAIFYWTPDDIRRWRPELAARLASAGAAR